MEILDIIQAYNIPVDWETSPAIYGSWDGQVFHFKGLKQDVMLHELAHWIVCAESRRKCMDFGLGDGPETPYAIYQAWMEKHPEAKSLLLLRSDDEETLTCVMEFFLGAILEYDMMKYLADRYFVERGRWDNRADFYCCIDLLIRRKLISKHWVPIQLRSILKKKHLKLIREFKKLTDRI